MEAQLLDPNLLSQRIGSSQVTYSLTEGVVYDRTQIVNTITTLSNSIFASPFVTNYVQNEAWIKWEPDGKRDLMVKLPGYIVGHRIIMLGAKAVDIHGNKKEVEDLAIFNLNTGKAYLCYNTLPTEGRGVKMGDTHDVDNLAVVCLSPRDRFFADHWKINVGAGGALGVLLGLLMGAGILVAFVCGLVGAFLGFSLLIVMASQGKGQIKDRIWSISKALKCQLLPKFA